MLELALALGTAILALAIVTTALEGGRPGRLLALKLLPGLLLVASGLVWRRGPLHVRGYLMIGGYWAGVIASGLGRGYSIPNPWVGALFVCVLAALVFDRRRAWLAVAGTTLVWVGVSVPWVRGWSVPDDAFADPSQPLNWVRVIVIFTLFAGASVGGILFMVTRLEEALRRGESLYAALEAEVDRRLAGQRDRHALELRLQQAQKLEALGTLAGSMAHDVNNLLQVIATNAEVAMAEDKGDERRHAVEDLRAATERAGRLTHQLLAFGQHRGADESRIDVEDSVRSTLELVQPLLSGIEFEQVHGEGVPVLFGPTSAVQQIVMNLVLNARDALHEGGVIRVTTERVVRESHGVDTPHCLLSVIDEGEGMDSATVAKVFDPFFTTKGAGTGLGMHLVRTLAEACGGSAEVDSEVGRGTVVKVFLPERHESARLTPPAPPVRPRVEKGKLLVVDDDAAVRRILSRFLQREGYEVVQAGGGASALEIYRADPDSFVAVVSDVMMPGMGGRDLYEALAEIQPDLRFLVCSGYTADVFEEGFFQHPRRSFLGKPFKRAELLEAVSQILST